MHGASKVVTLGLVAPWSVWAQERASGCGKNMVELLLAECVSQSNSGDSHRDETVEGFDRLQSFLMKLGS